MTCCTSRGARSRKKKPRTLTTTWPELSKTSTTTAPPLKRFSLRNARRKRSDEHQSAVERSPRAAASILNGQRSWNSPGRQRDRCCGAHLCLGADDQKIHTANGEDGSNL